MEYLVLKTLPQGQQPGETVDLPEEVGNVFLLVGAVEKIEPATDKPARGRYRRADLRADSSDLVSEP